MPMLLPPWKSAAGLYHSAFSGAKADPGDPCSRPDCFLGDAARRLIRFGQAVYLIEVQGWEDSGSGMSLSWNQSGEVTQEEDWTYELRDGTGPLKTETIHASRVLRSGPSPICRGSYSAPGKG